jgi:hypothetical protein
MQDFNELLRSRLEAPVKDKMGNAIVNQETGEHFTALEAMVMSVVNNAMKGDIASIAFIRNITKTTDVEADEARAREMGEYMKEVVGRLRKQLQSEGLYDGQDQEIEMLAETVILTEQLTAQMHSADFSATRDEFRRDGSTQVIVNPIIKLRDEQQNRFRAELERIRNEASRRKYQKKHGAR